MHLSFTRFFSHFDTGPLVFFAVPFGVVPIGGRGDCWRRYVIIQSLNRRIVVLVLAIKNEMCNYLILNRRIVALFFFCKNSRSRRTRTNWKLAAAASSTHTQHPYLQKTTRGKQQNTKQDSNSETDDIENAKE